MNAKDPRHNFDPSPSDSDFAEPPFDATDSDANLDNTIIDEFQLDNPLLLQQSDPFVGRWNNLVSTTNWEKGRIIAQWRTALRDSGASVGSYSDEAWSQRVGGVTPQHVGRLRRVFERFHSSCETYTGLYWSHFLAAIDWTDAEIWLQGAASSNWSVSQMRAQRWEAVSGDPSLKPKDSEIISGELDEDFIPLSQRGETADFDKEPADIASGPRAEDPDFGDEKEWSDSASPEVENLGDQDDFGDASVATPFDNPFASLPTLPADIAEALEQFKLAIIRHRTQRWGQVAQEDVVQAILALKAFCERGG
jgi:hypothetical protein